VRALTVSIVILHLNDQPALRACLRSCQQIQYGNHEIVVVENGSHVPLDMGELRAWAGRATTIIKSPTNVGYARGNNLGIRAAMAHGAEYVLLLNDDTEVAPDFLEVLVRTGEASDHVGALGPRIYYFDEPKKIWFTGARFDPHTCQTFELNHDGREQERQSAVLDSDWLTGCCVLVKRQAIEKAGYLDERFFIYWEDMDWGLRMHASGFRNVVVPSAHIWHKVSVTMGGPESPRKVYHKTRSHLLFAKLHAPHALLALQQGFLRDIAWLLFKSSQTNRLQKARAYLSAIKDYHLGRMDRGPEWLWRDR